MQSVPFIGRSARIALCLLVIASLFLTTLGSPPAPAALAASLTVNSNADVAANDGQCTLREAIINANNDNQSGSTDCAAGSGADTITFSLPVSSTITLSSSLPAITSTLTIDGSTAAGLTVSGGGISGRQPFFINSGAVVTLNSLTVAQVAGGNGAIRNQGTLTLNNSVVRDNLGTTGLHNDGGTLVVNNSAVYNNLTSQGAGLRVISGTVTLNYSTIYSNTGTSSGGGLAISTAPSNMSTVTLNYSAIYSNTAGISAGTGGGGVYASGSGVIIITLNNSVVYSNTAVGNGGGLFLDAGTMTLNNSTVSGNSATSNGSGGGLFLGVPTVTLNHSTISNNNASGDGGGIFESDPPNGNTNLQHTILANNGDGGSNAPDCSGTLTSLGYNLIKSTTGCAITTTTGDLTAIDPLLGPLADNGGPTLTHALLPGSAAIDKIPFGTNGCGLTPDQRGTPRPQPQGTIYFCDIGAYELAYGGPGGVTKSGFVYALRDEASGNQIYGFEANAFTGALTALPGFPVATGGTGGGGGSDRMAYDAVNARLYVINDGSDTVSGYAVNTVTGGLTPLPFSPISLPSAIQRTCVVVHPSGSPLVVGEVGGGLASFNITAFSATPAAGSPYNAAVAIWSCAYSRDGAYLYLGDGDINAANLAGFSMNASTGVLTALPGSPFESGAATPLALATDNAGRLFVGDFNANPNQLRAFTTSGGVPSAVTGNPFTSGLTDSYHGVWHPAGFYMVADQAGSRVGVYLIGGSGISTTLTAVSGSPFASGGISTSLLALSETGEFLFAANITSRNLTSFGVNPGNGALVALTQPANTLGNSGFITGLAFAPLEYYQVYLPLVRK